MKWLTMVLFAFILNLSAFNVIFYSHNVPTAPTVSIEIDSEKMDVAELSDLDDDPYLYLFDSTYIPFTASHCYLDFSSFYEYDNIRILLKPPELNLFVYPLPF